MYRAAAIVGADSLEEDLHLTKDRVLVARHNPWLSDNTNIAEVARTNPAVAARKRTVPAVLVNVKYPATPENGPPQYLSDLTDPNDPTSVLRSLVVDGRPGRDQDLRRWHRAVEADDRPAEGGAVPGHESGRHALRRQDLGCDHPAADQPDRDAHKAGLFVHAYTFRNENRYLAADYQGDPHAEYLKFFRLGIDGVFSDFPNTAFEARLRYLKETRP